MKEYLPAIGSRHKWFLPTENLKVGDVVLEIEPKTPRQAGESDALKKSIQDKMDLSEWWMYALEDG